MNSLKAIYPIYTEKTECLDCYKCVRECPVKAITFINGHASVDQELCVFCGRCVTVCPAGAKRARNDLGRVKSLLSENPNVILSIAPSWRGEFPGVTEADLIAAAETAGFAGVSETAIGAEAVSKTIGELFSSSGAKLLISSACPSVVEYICKYKPEFRENITPVLSPMLTHCSIIKQTQAPGTEIVFAGPCLSKKRESDGHSELCRAAVSFLDLRDLLGADLRGAAEAAADKDKTPVLGRSGKAALYPYEGGMIESIQSSNPVKDDEIIYMSFSGLDEIAEALEGLNEIETDRKIFLELLSCRGGCINGPGCTRKGSVLKKLQVIENSLKKAENDFTPGKIDENWSFSIKQPENRTDEEIKKALSLVGKYGKEDELNCGGCGYNTCREFAVACLDGKAETVMCVSHMRRLAQKKANIIIEKMPSGVVIVDEALRILESNRRFAEMMGEETMVMWESRPMLEGAMVDKILPFSGLFETVLKRGGEILDRNIQFNSKVLSVTVFPIIEHQTACAIIQDVTLPWVNRDRVIRKAEEVISRNLETVQQIAYLLGENAAENEVIMNSIIESFSGEKDA